MIAQIHGLLIRLVVIDAEHADVHRRIEDQASVFRSEEARPRVPHVQEGLKAMEVGSGNARRHAIQLGLPPGNGKRDRRVEQNVEIVSVAGELPEIFGVHHQVFADTLLKPGVVLIALPRAERCRCVGAEHVGGESAHAGGAGEQQVLVIRRFHGVGVPQAQHGPRLLDQKGKAAARLDAGLLAQPVVLVDAQAVVEGEVPQSDRILAIESELVDFAGIAEMEQDASARQVVGNQSGRQVGVGSQTQTRAGVGIRHRQRSGGVAIGIHADRVEGGVGNAQKKIFEQARLLEFRADFEIVHADHRGDIGAHAVIQQVTVLRDGCRSVVVGIAAGVVVHEITPDPRIHGE